MRSPCVGRSRPIATRRRQPVLVTRVTNHFATPELLLEAEVERLVAVRRRPSVLGSRSTRPSRSGWSAAGLPSRLPSVVTGGSGQHSPAATCDPDLVPRRTVARSAALGFRWPVAVIGSTIRSTADRRPCVGTSHATHRGQPGLASFLEHVRLCSREHRSVSPRRCLDVLPHGMRFEPRPGRI